MYFLLNWRFNMLDLGTRSVSYNIWSRYAPDPMLLAFVQSRFFVEWTSRNYADRAYAMHEESRDNALLISGSFSEQLQIVDWPVGNDDHNNNGISPTFEARYSKAKVPVLQNWGSQQPLSREEDKRDLYAMKADDWGDFSSVFIEMTDMVTQLLIKYRRWTHQTIVVVVVRRARVLQTFFNATVLVWSKLSITYWIDTFVEVMSNNDT